MSHAGLRRFVWIDALDSIPAHDWDALHASDHPFVQHGFLAGLESTGCLRPQWGWRPCHATLWHEQTLLAAIPGYRKGNSWGEFVFDHAWAEAYARHGRHYYPKWLGAIPYSPVPGPRLLARTHEHAQALLQVLPEACRRSGFSSAHINFIDSAQAAWMQAPDWMSRHEVQFHWHNAGWPDFDAFLAAMNHKHRKNIRQERQRVQRQGIRFVTRHGFDIRPDELEAMHGFYLSTFDAHGTPAALTLDFFTHLARHMPQALVVFLALREDSPIAGALCLRSHDTLYGRYWGTQENISGLHFETCYYQGIEYCLREKLQRFEPGAQGEHKLARGFLPVLTESRHSIFDPEFEPALRHWCQDECAALQRYRQAALAHSPFRQEPA